MKYSRVRDFPKHRKPREKLLEKGEQALSDEELLAIILRAGYKGKNVLELSRYLLSRFGLKELEKIPLKELIKIKGVGKAKATAIKAIFELAKRINRTPSGPPVIDSPRKVADILWEITEKKKEYFIVLYLNARNELIGKEEISVGTLEQSLVHPREVFKPVFTLPASSLILVHNHPSGNPEPSEEDILITKRLEKVAEIIGVEILDHVILSRNGSVSMKERKMLKS